MADDNNRDGELVSFREVSKSFGGTKALDGVTFALHSGQILALLGENGAGKSTLIKAMAGVHRLDSGDILIEGEPLRAGNRGRIAFMHQNLGLVGPLSVAENIALGLGYARRGPLINWARTRRAAQDSLDALGVALPVGAAVNTLSRADRSLVALARCLATSPSVIVLDEPTASLAAHEVDQMFTVLRRLRDQGVGLMFVSHRIDEVKAIADEAAVMRDGHLVGLVEDLTDVPARALIEMIVGRPQTASDTPRVRRRGNTVLSLDRVSGGQCEAVSLDVAAGEVVGLTGLRGAGHESVARIVCGLEALESGAMQLAGAPYAPTTPLAALRSGVVYITGDRETEGMAPSMSVRENLFLNPGVRGVPTFRPIGRKKERKDAFALVDRYDIRPRAVEQIISGLSGGNQQKVIIARSMILVRGLAVLVDPTLGVDVGAKALIYSLLRDAAADGLGVLLVSSDFEEVTALADRALIMRNGSLWGTVPHESLSIQALTSAAAAGEAA